VQFFVLCRDDRFQPADLRGSYVGAVGMAQFMPRTPHAGLDKTATPRRPVVAGRPIGSVANYW